MPASENVSPAATVADVTAVVQGAMKAVHQSVLQAVGRPVRSQHPKGLGILRATLKIHDLPAEFRVGLFAAPRSFATWLRFSNGKEFDDRQRDVRGLAIKVCEVSSAAAAESSNQDLVLANSPVFFAKDAGEFLKFLLLKKTHGEQLQQAPAAERDALTTRQLQEQLQAFPALLQFSGPPPESLLRTSYFSQTPYRFGDRVVKYVLRPVARSPLAFGGADSPNLLTERLQQELQQGPAEFELGVIVQQNPENFPLEDATREWPAAGLQILATLSIPPQNFLAPEQVRAGELLSFNPARTLPEHQPLGSLNRARDVAYRDSSELRHNELDEPAVEPVAGSSNHPHTHLLRQFFQSLVAKDLRGLLDCLHPEVEFHDIGFDLKGSEVATMWRMLCAKEMHVSFGQIQAGADSGTAAWECEYEFLEQENSRPRPVQNSITSKFQFRDGLIVAQHDECDFWKWFQQAIGPKASFLKVLDIAEDFLEGLVGRDIPPDVEAKARAAVKAKARQKIEDFQRRTP